MEMDQCNAIKKDDDTTRALDPVVECKISIPAEAMGRIIGARGSNINALRAMTGMEACELKSVGLNTNELSMRGSKTAIAQASSEIQFKLTIAKKQLQDTSTRGTQLLLVWQRGHALCPTNS